MLAFELLSIPLATHRRSLIPSFFFLFLSFSFVFCRTICFDPEGAALYSGGQDSLHAYSWEPCECLDSYVISWGRVADIKAIDETKLIGASFNSNIVSIWAVDLKSKPDPITPVTATPPVVATSVLLIEREREREREKERGDNNERDQKEKLERNET